MSRMWSFAKGHGTKNDFVLLTDPDDTLAPTDDQVRFLCDRRAGIGGDGILRAVRARHIDTWTGDPDLWFMDYRNADGSLAEMCGNGLRVFVRYLVEEGLASGEEITVGTRAGLRTGTLLPDGRVRVGMGRAQIGLEPVTVRVGDQTWLAIDVNVGNPHAVSVLPAHDDLDALDLCVQPTWQPVEAFPAGVNLEFVRVLGPDHLAMRVHERGVGETLSCGTGIVASAAALAFVQGRSSGEFTVDVRGGTTTVELVDNQAWLTRPAEIVARGEVRLP